MCLKTLLCPTRLLFFFRASLCAISITNFFVRCKCWRKVNLIGVKAGGRGPARKWEALAIEFVCLFNSREYFSSLCITAVRWEALLGHNERIRWSVERGCWASLPAARRQPQLFAQRWALWINHTLVSPLITFGFVFCLRRCDSKQMKRNTKHKRADKRRRHTEHRKKLESHALSRIVNFHLLFLQFVRDVIGRLGRLQLMIRKRRASLE